MSKSSFDGRACRYSWRCFLLEDIARLSSSVVASSPSGHGGAPSSFWFVGVAWQIVEVASNHVELHVGFFIKVSVGMIFFY